LLTFKKTNDWQTWPAMSVPGQKRHFDSAAITSGLPR
jgi:hypothetical protein